MLFEFQAMTAAAVLSNQAFIAIRGEEGRIPQASEERKGLGNLFHSLKDDRTHGTLALPWHVNLLPHTLTGSLVCTA